nr:DUF6879 family protein [Streptomyces scabiei]
MPTWHDDLRLIDSTPLPCAASRETAKRSERAGHAGYGYCRSHVERDAFHLELRDDHSVSDEDSPFTSWLCGETVAYSSMEPWARLRGTVGSVRAGTGSARGSAGTDIRFGRPSRGHNLAGEVRPTLLPGWGRRGLFVLRAGERSGSRNQGCRHADSAARCTTRRAPDRHQPRSGALLGLLEEGDSYATVVSGASVAAVLAVWGLLPLLNAK